MATVRLSQELCLKILQNASDLFETRINNVKDSLAKDYGKRVYEHVLSEHIEHIRAVPQGYYPENDCMHVYINDNFPNVVVHFLTDERVPKNMYEDSWNNRRSIPVVQDLALKQEYLGYMRRVIAVNEEKDKFVDEVKGLIERCTTLRQALKVWPQIEKLIPKEVMDRHYTKTTNKRAELEVEVSDNLNQAILRNSVINSALGGQ